MHDVAHRLASVGWPKSTNEPLFYKPFADLLNSIISACRPHCQDSHSFYFINELHFLDWNKALSGVDSAAGLKPDIVGVSRSLSTAHSLSWDNIHICVEVKNNDYGLFIQSSTYARAMFASRLKPLFVIVIMLNQKRTLRPSRISIAQLST